MSFANSSFLLTSSIKAFALSMLLYSGILNILVKPSMYRLTLSMSSSVFIKLGIILLASGLIASRSELKSAIIDFLRASSIVVPL